MEAHAENGRVTADATIAVTEGLETHTCLRSHRRQLVLREVAAQHHHAALLRAVVLGHVVDFHLRPKALGTAPVSF